MSCVNCYYDLCDILVCDNEADIVLPVYADMSGTYTLVLDFLGTAKVIQTDLAVGDRLIFFGCNLNENFCYEGYVLRPDQSIQVIDSSNSAYTGLKFCTKQKVLC